MGKKSTHRSCGPRREIRVSELPTFHTSAQFLKWPVAMLKWETVNPSCAKFVNNTTWRPSFEGIEELHLLYRCFNQAVSAYG